MCSQFTRRETIESLVVLALASRASSGVAGAQEDDSDEDEPTLNRFATTAIGAEITGLFLTEDGHLFFNVQHPQRDNAHPFDVGVVGALTGFNMNELPEDFGSLQMPENRRQAEMVRTAFGKYQVLARGGENIGGGEQFGIPRTPDGTPLTEVPGPGRGFGHWPDFNGFVSADADDEGYLFTNFETLPGMVTRLHLRQRGENGPWEVLDAMNVDFRDVEGTMINCFGSVSPWGTPLSAEEVFSHTVTQYWNRPNPSLKGVDDGVEKVARYLGGTKNEEGVFADVYPNPYRYGYIVEIENPQSDPTPNKLFALGRFAHENSVVMPDEKTVYSSSDGTGKCFYKFVADEAGDLSSGTLHVATVSQDGAIGGDPADVSFDLEWIELAHGDEDEIESWIAEYDDVTQADYPGDDAVAADGNPNYITEDEIQAWAAGDAADDRVAFLESRAAARELGATLEFRKMEGINIRRNAQPGDYLYVAMSNTNQTMADDEGDIQINGDEYGAVYRLELEEEYNVSRMEPAVVGGPNANICGGCPFDAAPNSASTVCQQCEFNPTRESDEGIVGKGMAALETVFGQEDEIDLVNTVSEPDNLLVMDDGRVIIGEDTGNESHFENNMIWVFNPGSE